MMNKRTPSFAFSTPFSWRQRQSAVESWQRPAQRLTRRRAEIPRQKTHHSIPSRRPRGSSSVKALFIWSNDFEDDGDETEGRTEDHSSGRDIAGDDDVLDASDEVDASEESTWNSNWHRGRSEPPSMGNSAYYDGEGHTNDDTWGSTGSTDDNKNGAFSSGPTEVMNNGIYTVLRGQTSGPHDLDRMRRVTSDCVLGAFRKAVTGILGTLPADAYDVVITCDRPAVSRMMQSGLCTGYSMRNAEIRMILNEAMSARRSTDDSSDGVLRSARVDTSAARGSVRWWDGELEVAQDMAVRDFIARLEAENELLRERLSAATRQPSDGNKLIAFMKTLNAEKLTALQADMTDLAADAFTRTIHSTLGDLDSNHVQTSYSVRRDYLGQLLLWCLHVGYTVRNIEKRLEMTRIFEQAEAFTGPWV